MTTNSRRRYGGKGTFDSRLRIGDVAEDEVAAWAERLGFFVARLSSMPPGERGGPRLRGPYGLALVAPDLALWRDGVSLLLEVKRRRNFDFHRATGRWVTGMSNGQFMDYLMVGMHLGVRVFVAFVHDDEPGRIVGGEVDVLARTINHDDPESGMVFWSRQSLPRLDTLPDFAPVVEQSNPNDSACADDEAQPDGAPEPAQATAAAKKPVLDLDFGA